MSSEPKVKQHTEHIRSIGPDINGQYWVRDDRMNEGRPFSVSDELHLAAYIHQHSSEADFYPLGDVIHEALVKLGAKKPCLPCAERQAWLNRWIKRRG